MKEREGRKEVPAQWPSGVRPGTGKSFQRFLFIFLFFIFLKGTHQMFSNITKKSFLYCIIVIFD